MRRRKVLRETVIETPDAGQSWRGDPLLVARIFHGSDGNATTALYKKLAEFGPAGDIAAHIFRAVKTSLRAKVYRGGVAGEGSYKSMAYGRKEWSIEQMCKGLVDHGAALGMVWGWAIDEEQPVHRHLLYVELPTGQISFHTIARDAGPDFPGRWDGVRGAGPVRVCQWVVDLIERSEQA